MPLICTYAQFTFVNIHSSILFTFRSKLCVALYLMSAGQMGAGHMYKGQRQGASVFAFKRKPKAV